MNVYRGTDRYGDSFVLNAKSIRCLQHYMRKGKKPRPRHGLRIAVRGMSGFIEIEFSCRAARDKEFSALFDLMQKGIKSWGLISISESERP